MPVPNIGLEKSLGKIRQEMESDGNTSNDYDNGPYTSDPTSLEQASDYSYGGIDAVALALGTIDGTDTVAPHGMDEHSNYEYSDPFQFKIICSMMNEFYGTPPIMNKIWLKHSATMKNKDEITAGYHAIFLPLVSFAKKEGTINYIVRKIIEEICISRTKDVKAEMENTKRHLRGRIWRFIFEPICYVVGLLKIKLKKL